MCYPICTVLYTGILAVLHSSCTWDSPSATYTCIMYLNYTICTFVSLFCIQGFWLYSFIMYLGFPLSYNGHEYTKVFDLISWIISAVPYIAIPAAAMHSCGLFEGTCKEVSYWVKDLWK